MDGRRLVFVTVGSDHHPFDRLVSWLDNWFANQTDGHIRCVIQYGTSKPPDYAEGHPFIGHDHLQQLMQEAAVIVTQGGPMSIVESWRAGSMPIVVPRDPDLGEHVDGHQQAFGRRMHQEGKAFVPADQVEFSSLLNQALADPEKFAAKPDETADDRVLRSAQRVGALVDRLVPRPASSRPRILLIVGVGRSGSTLFERALGEVAGVEPLGETVHLWERGLRDDELCGCGKSFSQCSFWQPVGQHAFGGWNQLDADEVVELRHAVVRTRYMLRLLGPSFRTSWRLQRNRLAGILTALYAAAAEVSGGDLLVDSSKMPAYAALVSRADVDLRCVQFVRDPRGVAYSWSKLVRRPEVLDGSATMHRYSPAQSVLWWSVFDLMFRLLGRFGIPVTSVRYEDFVADPRSTVSRVLDFAGHVAAPGALEYLEEDSVDLESRHLVAGNPMRFTAGHVDVEADEEWKIKMSRRDRQLVSALTSGLRRRYGY